jgi:transposase
MASLDKTSVRTAVNQLKTDFENLCAEGRVTCESKALMISMFMIVELILSIFLEKTTQKTTKIPAYLPLKPKKMNHRWARK